MIMKLIMTSLILLLVLVNDSFTDIDKFVRLCTCANVLKVEDYNVYLPYYYFNEEKDKTLIR